jgi:hypothetical protein
MFVEKSNEELAGMDAKELQAYYVAKLKSESEAMELRVKKLETEVNPASIVSLENEVKAIKDNQIKSLNSALEAQGVVLKKLEEGKVSGANMLEAEGTVKSALLKYADDFKSAKEGRHSFKFEVKAVGDMMLSTNITGQIPQADRLEGVNDIALREAKTYSLFPKFITQGNTVEWVFETSPEGSIDGTSEGGASDQLDTNFEVSSVSLVKRSAHYKVSVEMLDDVSFMEGWLRNKLIVRLFLDVDNQCLNGGGTGNNLAGILSYATAFSAGSFANAIDNANEVDALVVSANQIRLAHHRGALTIMMHPSDITKLKVEKLSSTDKRYVERLAMAGESLSIDGMPIVENVNITEGDYLIGEFSKATIVEKRGIELELGLDGNDFIQGMRTIQADWRGQLFVQDNDASAFVKGTFATVKSALETA